MDPKEIANIRMQQFKDSREQALTPKQKEVAKTIIRKFKAIQQEPLPDNKDCTGGDLFGRYLRGFYEACRILGLESVSKHETEIESRIVWKFNDLQQRQIGTKIDCTGFDLFAEYMHGFVIACRTIGFKIGHSLVEEAVILESGLEMSPLAAKAPLNQLKEQGLDDETLKDKMLDMDIEILRRIYDITEE
jgi:hypothetical protein